jgi:hypothetical protein
MEGQSFVRVVGRFKGQVFPQSRIQIRTSAAWPNAPFLNRRLLSALLSLFTHPHDLHSALRPLHSACHDRASQEDRISLVDKLDI